MSPMPPHQPDVIDAAPDNRYEGFSLRSVCWGYREVFARTIEGLFDQGWIGPDRRAVTKRFFSLLQHADRQCFDHVLKEFLGAVNPTTRWLLDLPGIFVDVVDLGQDLAQCRLHYGMTFFRTLGAGGFGDRPEQLRNLVAHVRRLWAIDVELAVAFLKGYRRLIDSLRPEEIPLYVQVGLDVFGRDRKKGLAFMETRLKTSETYIRHISRECRLGDVHGVMTRLLRALTGLDVDVCELGRLDADDLIERGSSVVCLGGSLYVPARVRHFDETRRNRTWYLLTALATAGMLVEDGFSRVHGQKGMRSCRDLVGAETLRLNLFQVTEFVRVLRRMRRRWPGARRLLSFALEEEFRQQPPRTGAERLFHDAVGTDDAPPGAVERLRRLAEASVNCYDTARLLDDELLALASRAYPGLDRDLLRPFAFLPDPMFPGHLSGPQGGATIADLRRAAERRDRPKDQAPAKPAIDRVADGAGQAAADSQADEADGARACYVYDEWSQEENDYYRNHCFVYESQATSSSDAPLPTDIAEQARRVGRVFERLRPDLARREKYLHEGERVNVDLLVEYLVHRRRQPAPKVRFYEKPRINRRDLAALILLDISGSTAEEVADGRPIIEIEKHAALILGQGLASLGDRFEICGFHSNGPEKCVFVVYKDLDDSWDRQAMARVLAARPLNCTRIGPALRHAGFRLARVDAKQRLILLVTDGRPMDDRYDPNTRYAQYDVRMACQENARQSIHTFGISTEANTLSDMEIMFPRRRFVILPDLRRLPSVLPKLYTNLTT